MTKNPVAASGISRSPARLVSAGAPTVELFGHVTLVEGYAVPGYTGIHALVWLRDTPDKTIAVITKQGMKALGEPKIGAAIENETVHTRSSACSA